MKTLKALAALLTYPSRALVDALPEIYAVIVEEDAVARRERDRLKALLHWMAEHDPLDLEAAYVETFDRGRATSLHLFEHLHGESRDRGQAMVDLKSVYARGGLHLKGNELPDYLPALLEYLSTRPAVEAREMLADCAHILRSISRGLAKRDSLYAAVVDSALSAAGQKLISAEQAEEPAEKPMDEEWAEEPVIFGPAAGQACTPGTGRSRYPGQSQSRAANG